MLCRRTSRAAFCEPRCRDFVLLGAEGGVGVLYACYTSLHPQFPSFRAPPVPRQLFFFIFCVLPFLFYSLFFRRAGGGGNSQQVIFYAKKSLAHTHARALLFFFYSGATAAAACCSPCEKAARELRNERVERDSRAASAPEAELLLKIMFSPRIIFARMKNVLSDGDNS